MTAKIAIAVMLLTAVAVMVFAGCGGGAGDGSPTANPTAETPDLAATSVAQAVATVVAQAAATVTAQSVAETPAPIATAMAQAAATVTAQSVAETPAPIATAVAQAAATVPAQSVAETPAPIATAMAQAATVQAAYATPVPETETDYCGRLCQFSFWPNASIADLDDEISKGAAVNAKYDDTSDDDFNWNFNGYSPLHFAVRSADISVIEALLDRGADLAAVGADNDETALHIAASWTEDARPDIVGLLLERGANANAQNNRGEAPLHYANDALVAALLLNYGADVNAVDDDGKTRLFTVSYNLSYKLDSVGGADAIAILRLLLEHGADVNAVADDGSTPLLAAAGSNADIVELLLEHGADVNAVADDGFTPLLAAARRNADIVALLLEHGADDVNAVADGGHTPLFAVLDKLVNQRAGADDAITILRLLLENGADANAVPEGRSTPLNSAVFSGEARAVALLLKHGADVDAKDSEGRTACQYVREGLRRQYAEQSEIDAIRGLVCP